MPSKITSLINRLTRSVHCSQFAQGLNPAQWETLRYLSRANRYSRTPSALARFLKTTKGTASQTLKSLEAKGYVHRAPTPEDRRGILVNLTERGSDLLGRDPLQCLEASAAALGDEIPNANRLLARLVAALEQKKDSAGFGLCGECTNFCKNAAAAEAGGPHRCGLTDDPLSPDDSQKICVNHCAA